MDRGVLEPSGKQREMSVEGNRCLADALPEGTGVCVINLDSRTDRWESFRNGIAPGLAPLQVQRISATLGTALPGYGERPFFRGGKRDRTWAARGGCVLSHRDALSHAREMGWPYALVLEDDVAIGAGVTKEAAGEIKTAIGESDTDVCYLGFTDPVPPYLRVARIGSSHGFHLLFGCNTAHAYLVNRKAMDWILERLPEPEGIWRWLVTNRAVDRFYYRNMSPSLRVSAISPPLIVQSVGFSDIMGKNVDLSAGKHLTVVPEGGMSERDFQKALATKAKAFGREGLMDAFRGFVKSIGGF